MEVMERIPTLVLSPHLTIGYGRPLFHVGGNGLALYPGDVCAIEGPNGCGKTTLLNAICGLVTPLRGAISRDTVRRDSMRHERGWWPALDRVSKLARRFGELRRTFQIPVVCDEISVRSYVGIGRRIDRHEQLWGAVGEAFALRRNYGATRWDSDPASYERCVCEKLGLPCDDRTGETLSYGQRRIASLAQALVSGARLLLLDEASANLHRRVIVELERLLLDYVRGIEVRTVVVVEHRADLLRDILTTIWRMESGVLQEKRLREPWRGTDCHDN